MKHENQLFVYGSLREGFHHPAYAYISRYFSFVANAKIKGLLFDMGDYPAARPTEENKFIIGELYAIKNENEFNYAIEQLDDYEGLCPEEEEGETALFKRVMTTVYPEKKEPTQGWVYWYNKEIGDAPVIPSGDVLQFFLEKNQN